MDPALLSEKDEKVSARVDRKPVAVPVVRSSQVDVDSAMLVHPREIVANKHLVQGWNSTISAVVGRAWLLLVAPRRGPEPPRAGGRRVEFRAGAGGRQADPAPHRQGSDHRDSD
ncbi:hypothetical protein VSH64_15870 [Amycolatopsis rhabdoformis]|uniref:Uncharacterized protein n=1 Tax=Amycolatopsis rhabdoformis TaxID=1448059 RepID=A0ABZ1IJG4_9PSEU|nr:hypothetical protein [Amycolatopsis rhabdoformis]WSE33565.1 hypothetical protein VSH64_15870 [Amycolatopsis rhabdoformis]